MVTFEVRTEMHQVYCSTVSLRWGWAERNVKYIGIVNFVDARGEIQTMRHNSTSQTAAQQHHQPQNAQLLNK